MLLTFMNLNYFSYSQRNNLDSVNNVSHSTDNIHKSTRRNTEKEYFKKNHSSIENVILRKQLFEGKNLFSVSNFLMNYNVSNISFTDSVNIGVTDLVKYSDFRHFGNLSLTTHAFYLPFSLELNSSYSNISHVGFPADLRSLFSKYNFNYKQYLLEVKQQIEKKLDPNIITNVITSRLNKLKNDYSNLLKKDVDKIVSAHNSNHPFESIKLPTEIYDLDLSDINNLQYHLLFGKEYDKYIYSIQQLENFNSLVNHDKVMNYHTDSMYNVYLNSIKRYEKIQEVYNKIVQARSSYQNNETVQELKKQLPFSKNNFKNYLEFPENLREVVNNHFSLKSINQIFMRISKLDIGHNAIESKDLFSPQQFMNTGLNGVYESRLFVTSISAGRNNLQNQFLSGGLLNGVNDFDKFWGVQVKSRVSSFMEQTVSFNAFDIERKNQANNILNVPQAIQTPSLQRKDLVATFKNVISFGNQHEINVEISKSFGSFSNSFTIDSLRIKENNLNGLLGNSGESNHALSIYYNGVVGKGNLSFFVSNVGLGYNNPGNFILRRGETKFGINYKKRFFRKEQLLLDFVTDVRNQHFDPSKNHSFNSIHIKLRVQYRINKNNRIGVTYEKENFKQQIPNTNVLSNITNRLEVNGNYTIRVNTHQLVNHTMVGQLSYQLPLFQQESNITRSNLISHNSSLLSKKKVYSINLLYNNSSNNDFFFSTSVFNTEMSLSYPISSHFSSISGIGYFVNKHWNKQVGLQQQFGAIISNKFSMDIQVSYKKAIETKRKNFADILFFNSSVKYTL